MIHVGLISGTPGSKITIKEEAYKSTGYAGSCCWSDEFDVFSFAYVKKT